MVIVMPVHQMLENVQEPIPIFVSSPQQVTSGLHLLANMVVMAKVFVMNVLRELVDVLAKTKKSVQRHLVVISGLLHPVVMVVVADIVMNVWITLLDAIIATNSYVMSQELIINGKIVLIVLLDVQAVVIVTHVPLMHVNVLVLNNKFVSALQLVINGKILLATTAVEVVTVTNVLLAQNVVTIVILKTVKPAVPIMFGKIFPFVLMVV